MDLVLRDFLPAHIVIPVPFLIEWVLCEADVMAESKCPIMVDNTMQVIARIDLESVSYETSTRRKGRQIQITNREVNQVL